MKILNKNLFILNEKERKIIHLILFETCKNKVQKFKDLIENEDEYDDEELEISKCEISNELIELNELLYKFEDIQDVY